MGNGAHGGARTHVFVVSLLDSPDAVVESLGGTVLMRLPDPSRVLAVVPDGELANLRAHPDIGLAGPVPTDRAGFATFARLTGLDGNERHPRGASPEVGLEPASESRTRSACAAGATVVSHAATPLGAARRPAFRKPTVLAGGDRP